MAAENIQVLKLDAEKLGKNIEKIAREIVEQRAVWIEIREEESEELKEELEYFSEIVLAELHRRVFERVLPKFVNLEKIQPINEYEEIYENENKEEVWITENHEFHYSIQFNNEYYGNYVIIERCFGEFWYLELFVLRKVISKNKVKYLIPKEYLKYLKEYALKDLEILEKVKAIF